MAGFNDSNLGGLILNVYSKDAIQRLQNLTSPLLSSIKNAPSFTVGGNGFLFGANVEGNEAMGFRDSNQALPTASRENVQQATVSPRSIYATVQVTGLAKALASGQPSSFANVISYSLDQQMDRVTSYMEGALVRTNTNSLALLNESSPSGIELTLDTPGPLWLREGMAIDFISAAGVHSASTTISQVDWSSNSITTDTDISSSLTDNDGVFLTGEQDLTAGSLAARGFDGLEGGTATSGTYLNIARGTYPRWRGNTLSVSSALDEDLLYRAFVRTAQEGGMSPRGMNSFKILAHYNQCRKFAEVAYPRQRFSGTAVDLGVSKLSWNGNEVMDLPFIPETTVYGVDMTIFNKFVTANGDLQISTDFGQPWKFVPGFDSGSAYLRAYCNYVLRNPRKAFAITGLTDVTSR
jgi:hypothetical protein